MISPTLGLTVRKAKKAIQSCGSSMLKVPTGGRKKKSNASAAVTDAITATHSRDEAATKWMINRNDSATVVGLVTRSHEKYMAVRPAMTPMAASARATSAGHPVLVIVFSTREMVIGRALVLVRDALERIR